MFLLPCVGLGQTLSPKSLSPTLACSHILRRPRQCCLASFDTSFMSLHHRQTLVPTAIRKQSQVNPVVLPCYWHQAMPSLFSTSHWHVLLSPLRGNILISIAFLMCRAAC